MNAEPIGPAQPDDSQTGENSCPACAGSGRLDGQACPACGGSGLVTEVVGDA